MPNSPKTAPILIITDGCCEPHVAIAREHASLLTPGGRLPFAPRGPVPEHCGGLPAGASKQLAEWVKQGVLVHQLKDAFK